MRSTVGRLMLVIAVEAALARLALGDATYRAMNLGEFLGSWWTLNLMSILPAIILYLRMRPAGRTCERGSSGREMGAEVRGFGHQVPTPSIPPPSHVRR